MWGSRFWVPMKGVNPNAETYAAAARTSALGGTKKFVYYPMHDDRYNWSIGSKGRTDSPIINAWWFTKYRWMWHDFRMFGLQGTARKNYYFGDAWRAKDERIFVGKDQLGSKYWFFRRGGGNGTRLVEPVDAGWFRIDSGGNPPAWIKWLMGHTAHTPATMEARGEASIMTSWCDSQNFINYKWSRTTQFLHEGRTRDPGYFLNASLLNPEYKVIEESGFSRWYQTQASASGPIHPPFFGEHDFSDDLVEEYYRGQWAFCRANKGNDHDDWRG